MAVTRHLGYVAMLNSHKNTVGVPLFGAPEISRSGTFSRRRELVAAGLLLLAGPLAASGPEVTWREILATPLEADGLLGTAESFTDVVPERAVAIEGIRPFTEVCGPFTRPSTTRPRRITFSAPSTTRPARKVLPRHGDLTRRRPLSRVSGDGNTGRTF